jgi:anti-sigma B factor antagonist
MKVTTHTQGDAYVISLQGRILGDTESQDFMNTVKAAIIDGKRRVVFDLTDVEWMNSSGLGMLIAGQGQFKEVEGQIKLTGLNDSVSKIMHMNKLNLVFDIHTSLESAIKTFR